MPRLESRSRPGEVEVAKLLLDEDTQLPLGGDGSTRAINARDGKGTTPLMISGLKGDSELVMWLLNVYDAAWDARSNDRCDAFYCACAAGDILSAAALLARGRGVQINEVTENGNSPLHVAAYKGLTEMVRWLLRQGADRTILSKMGYDGLPPGTPGETARAANHNSIADLIDGFEPRRGAMEEMGTWKVELAPSKR